MNLPGGPLTCTNCAVADDVDAPACDEWLFELIKCSALKDEDDDDADADDDECDVLEN